MKGPALPAGAATATSLGVNRQLTTQFAQPAVGSTVAATLSSTSGLSDGTGTQPPSIVQIPGGGAYRVSSLPSNTQANLVFLGGDGRAAVGNPVRPAPTFDRESPADSDYVNGSNTAAFNMPAVDATTGLMNYTPGGWEGVGEIVQNNRGNFFRVEALSATQINLRNIGDPVNEAAGVAQNTGAVRPMNNPGFPLNYKVFGVAVDDDPRNWVLDALWVYGIYDPVGAGNPPDFVWLPTPVHYLTNNTANYTALIGVLEQTICYDNATMTATCTVTLPSAAACVDGQVVIVRLAQSGAWNVTIALANALNKLNGTVGGTMTLNVANTWYRFQVNKAKTDWMRVG